MPGKIKVKILAGRNLPVMDRSGDTTDAYVEIKFGNTTYKTDVCRKSLNPQWNSEWYRFEVDDAELQDEPLQVRLMDHDTYSANDAIGKVYVNLNPLLLPGLPPAVKNIWTLEATMNSSIGSQGGSVMTGWIPVFDTMHGIRGEVNIIVKVELFSDCNKFRQSSCGVQFFYSPNIPHGYHAQVIHGFVEELVVSDDPEYKWIDKIRTPRASNEARQTLFFKLSGEVQRKIGLKALDLGGNAVIGYVQNFDLEGESGIVARGIGTAVTLVKLQDITSILPIETSNIEDLTSFGLQSKNLYDLSESDDSLPLLSHSPNLTPLSRSPTNLQTTTVGHRFPKHEKSSKHHQRQSIRVSEYRAAAMRSRQFSLQHSNSGTIANQSPLRKVAVSSLSLADDLISESSLRNMLALEDMRGEPAGNPFSRGLKNFRYLHQSILPRRVAQIKSKISDSFDDESDPDTSTYSSTWSLAGSESNRSSSIVDLRQSIRRKKFTHKKTVNDGIAALLIRSVHSGFPLDSVREDRETPTPSPVNFLADTKEYSDEQMRSVGTKDSEIVNSNEESSSSRNDENYSENKMLLGKKRDIKYTSEILIPMMSSSETDTSTSDDEPSESSTNYNILDDTYSLVDPNSPDERKFDSSVRRVSKFTDTTGRHDKAAGRNTEIEIKNTDDEDSSIRSVGDENLESSTDYNILDDNCSLADPEPIDDGKFAENFQRLIEVAKISANVDKIGFSKSLEHRKDSKIERTDDIDRLSTWQRDRDVTSTIDNDILADRYSPIDPNSNNDASFESELYRAMSAVTFDEIPPKIYGISAKREESMIGTTIEGDRSSNSQSDENFESSTDYHILDEMYPPFDRNLLTHGETDPSFKRTNDVTKETEVSSTRPVIVSVILKKIEKRTEISEKIEDLPTDLENRLIDSKSHRDSEIRDNNRSIDDTCPPIDHACLDDASFEPKSSSLILSPPIKYIDDPSGNIDNVEVEPTRRPYHASDSQADRYLKSSIDSSILDENRSPIDRTRSDRGNLDSRFEPSAEVPKIPGPSSLSALISSASVDKIRDASEKMERVTIEQTNDGDSTSIMLRDCHSTSSTNDNFLDENYSLIDDEKIVSDAQRAIRVSKLFDIPCNATSISFPPEETIIKISETREEMKDDPEINENLSSISQSDEKLESSTDYNILDDTCSLIDSQISLDDARSDSSIQRAIEFMKLPEIPCTSTRPDLSSLEKTEKIVELQLDKDASPLSPPDTDLSHFLGTPPVSPNFEQCAFDYPVSRSVSPVAGSSSPNTKLKHLKFLPKQKRFDSTEDVGFVTSTPVETEISMFPDFEPKEKSFESTTVNFNTSISSSFGDKSNIDVSKFTVEDERLFSNVMSVNDKSSVVEKLPECTERQVCPLGITFDRITIGNETKVASTSKTPRTNQSEITDSVSKSKIATSHKDSEIVETKIPIAKRDKPQKKIERTDTVIYKGPAKDRSLMSTINRSCNAKTTQPHRTAIPVSPIPIVVAPPPEEHATRLQVPVIQTTNINVQSTFSPDEMKTQHFGSIGSRKFPIDEAAIGEKFNRKYRQHCMLDLLKTIDAKMMVHHMHHERRDSTKSKRKRRDRMNASATPSPDSIHRTKPHRRRSRSRSPDRPHVHSKNQVSSLSTHSFPNTGSSALLRSPSANPPQDSPSCDSSYENLSRHNANAPTVVGSIETVIAISKENTISPVSNDRRDDQTKDNKLPAAETIADSGSVEISSTKVESNETVVDVVESTKCLLAPNDIEHPVFKSHSAGSLERLRERFIVTTKTTNNSNTIDDLCVPCSPLILRQPDEQQPSSPIPASSALPSSLGSKATPNSTSAATKTNTAIPNMHRRSSDSDLSITPKGNSLAGSDRSMGGHLRPSTAIVRTMNQDTMEMLEYPFITMQQYPAGFVLNIGGLVSARSVKLLERITNLEEPEGRDAWWTEIRMEVRSHARALACNVVLGYKEEISICDDVCVLNASGTAAVINLLNASQDQDNVLLNRTIMTTSVESSERDKSQVKSSNAKTSDKSEESSVPGPPTHSSAGKVKRTISESNDHEIPYLPTLSACSLCHLPYSEASVPFRVDVSKCAICRRAKVPDVLFTTIELPENIPMTGRGVFLQATVCKCKRDLRGELNAKEISDCLPFLEYELHSLLLNKLKVKGMNAIFGLKVQVSVGERLVIGMAVGTAVYLTALPTPSVPKIASGNSWHNEEQLAEIQKTLIETVRKNREFYRLKPIAEMENGRSVTTSDTDESDDDLPDLDLGIGTKDACVLEVDDVEDMDRINLLMDERPPDDFHVVNTQTIPGLEDLEIVRNLQMFTQISRAKIPAGQFASMPSKYFARMLQTVLFKLRRMVPCALCDMQFKVALPEQDEIQLSVVGMALGLGEPTRFSKYKRKLIPNSASKDPVKRTDENDMIFSLDEDQADNTTGPQEPVTNQSAANPSNSSPLTGLSAQKHRPRSPFRTRSHMQHRHKHVPLKERYGVDITPLSYLPGGKIERYLGNLNFFFIRESTSIRENGGLSGFTHSFVTEILAIVRAHITALGGNAMVAFFMTQCVLLHSPHKNQGQSLINVGGDVVTVSYYGDDKYQGNQNC